MNIKKNTEKRLLSVETAAVAGPKEVRHFPEEVVGNKNDENVEMAGGGSSSEPPFDEKRQKVMTVLVKYYRHLLTNPDGGRHWIGTMTDLMELTHDVWKADHFVDRQGRQLSFKAMAAHICRVLHCRHLPNPYIFVEKSRYRKGTMEPILDRYTHLAIDYRLQNPMCMEIKYI